MYITIEHIEADTMEHIGFTPMPSYLTRFSSSLFCGLMRFVPAGEDLHSYIGESCHVEINQESIQRLTLEHAATATDEIVALPEADAFSVRGIVTWINTSPPNLVTIKAGEAAFVLSGKDLDGITLALGDKVTFSAYGVSLWDEAI